MTRTHHIRMNGGQMEGDGVGMKEEVVVVVVLSREVGVVDVKVVQIESLLL